MWSLWTLMITPTGCFGRSAARSRIEIDAFGEPSDAANWALSNSPHALIADVWMNGAFGSGLCRLLRWSLPPVAFQSYFERREALQRRVGRSRRGRQRTFQGVRIGDLVRALNQAINNSSGGRVVLYPISTTDIRDRIARQLDQAGCSNL